VLRWLPNLRELDLSATKITDVGLGYLSDMNQLHSLHVEGTAVTAAGVKCIRQAIPRLRRFKW
jgi:hypothetical protein